MIYLDSCVLIYALERDDEIGQQVRARLESATEVLAISPLVQFECLVGVLRAEYAVLYQSYQQAFARLRRITLSDDTFVSAAQLRAKHGLKTPDAIHLAAAVGSGCSALWTNDDRLQQVAGEFAVGIGLRT